MSKEMGTKADAESTLDNENSVDTPAAESGGGAPKRRNPRVELAFAGVTRTVNVPKTKTSEATQKQILKDVSGKVLPGEMVAVMGPSGCGKSQLLQVLSGYVTPDAGTITYNGKPGDESLRHKIGYMHQEEVFFGNLTVKEHLQFQIKLRLGNELTANEQQERVESAIRQLGLKKCENTLIGVIGAGISGGERKRLAFASEMVIDPRLLLCDEPTSGLDSAMAECVIQYLKSMTEGQLLDPVTPVTDPVTGSGSIATKSRGSVLTLGGAMSKGPRTTICTIHQPSPEVYALFDKVMFLYEGQVCYFGYAADFPSYLKEINFPCPNDTAPPEHMLRLISSSGTTEKDDLQAKLETCKKVVDAWGQHQASKNGKPDIDMAPATDDEPGVPSKSGGFVLLMKRELILRKRSKFMFKAVIGRTIFFGLLMGFVWWQVPIDGSLQALQSVNGALNMLCINSFITFAIGPVQTLPLAVPTIMREHQMGMCSLSAVFWSKTVSDFPLDCLFVVLGATLPFWMIGMGDNFEIFLQFTGVYGLSVMIGSSFGYFISFLAKTPEGAFVLMLALVFPNIMFNGFIISYEQIPEYFRWLESISFCKYVYEGFLTVVWGSREALGCEEGRICPFISGKSVLEFMGTTDEHLLRDTLIGVLYIVVFRALALLCLVRRGRSK
eukprot:gnl/MRDRNA2_/MRDRNA2_17812_c0_seq1.p1 gnl/MRDRNA2_/MRDRNA2_17812_c0~~gnl/MRDRNA2_/MRDRNA2_17812_c0_seq1.p1  ORF type:complete len:771 (+),score=135.43 gnl/MRDRNA2_/MRDRNA2_17812_c0_seq1:313-2313(+)